MLFFPEMILCANTVDVFSWTSLLRKSGVWRRFPMVVPEPSAAWHMEQFFLYDSPAESAFAAVWAPAIRPAGCIPIATNTMSLKVRFALIIGIQRSPFCSQIKKHWHVD